jgi:hypothetical protein
MKARLALVRLAVTFSTALTLFGCSRQSAPQLPTVPGPTVATAPKPVDLVGLVISSSGNCVEGATVEVVSGQALGQKVSQSTPCDHWDFGGGFLFKDLTPGVAITLRASAPGWGTQEQIVVPASFTPGQPYRAIEFVLVPDGQAPSVHVQGRP